MVNLAIRKNNSNHLLNWLKNWLRNWQKTLIFKMASAVGKPGFVLEEDEFEYGVGIHGEPGYKKEQLQPSAKLAEELVEKLAEDFDIQDGERYGVLINGLGATPLMEQYVFSNDVAQLLAKKGVVVNYKKIGNYMTSIDMAGLSLTLIKLEDPSWIDALQAPVEVVAW
ncbi:hypothetical protein HO503_07340 [Streptococcus suis]|nr:hypothetical protein [Streptococcus suis]NQK60308.1 hypothetical protein [Streptococcus suis]